MGCEALEKLKPAIEAVSSINRQTIELGGIQRVSLNFFCSQCNHILTIKASDLERGNFRCKLQPEQSTL